MCAESLVCSGYQISIKYARAYFLTFLTTTALEMIWQRTPERTAMQRGRPQASRRAGCGVTECLLSTLLSGACLMLVLTDDIAAAPATEEVTNQPLTTSLNATLARFADVATQASTLTANAIAVSGVSQAPESQLFPIPSLSQVADPLRVSLRDIQVLTFKAGHLATRLRTSPPPQLKCISGCTGELPTGIQCKNNGWDGSSVNWRCEANLARGWRLRDTRVHCEAFTEGDPEYILKNSCSLEYSLGGRSGGSGGGNGSVRYTNGKAHGKTNPVHYIVPIIMTVIVVIILCAVVKACTRGNQESSGVVMGPPPGQYPGGQMAPGSGFYPGQPAGYPGQPGGYPAQPGFNPNLVGPQPGYGPPPMVVQQGGGGSRWGPGLGGFAAGAATGGLLGYMMGNRGGTSEHHYHHGSSDDYGAYRNGGDGGNPDTGGGYEMSVDFADTVLE